MTSIALYTLAHEYQEAASKLAELDLPDEVINDTLEGLSGDLEAKATNVAMFIKNLEVSADAIKAAEQTLSQRRKAIEARMQRVHGYLQFNMENCGISKIESPYLTISLQKNPAAVKIEDETLIPADYMRQPETPPPAPDKKLIAQAIKDGYAVPGCKLEQSQRLVIK